MANNPRITNAAAIAAVDAVVDLVDGGVSNGYIECRTGAQPAGADSAATGTLLGTLNMSDPAFGAGADAAPGGRATANSVTGDTSADATGTIGYCRVYDSAGTAIFDGEAGTSGADFNFDSVSVTAGGAINLTSMTVTMPES